MAAKAQTIVVGTDFFGGTTTIYNSSGAVLSTIATPSPYGLTDNGAGDLFVAQTDSGTIGEYTTSGATISTTFISGLGPVRGVAYSAGLLYSIDDNGTVDLFNATTGSVIKYGLVQIASGHGSGVAVLGTTLYVSDPINGTVGTYNATTGAAINTSFLTNLNSPRLLSISGNNLLVPLLGSNSVAEYNATTGALEATFAGGLSGPTSAILNGSDLYAANSGANTVTKNGTTFASGFSLSIGVDVIVLPSLVLVQNGICLVSIENIAAGGPSSASPAELNAAQNLQAAIACATGVTPPINPPTPAPVQIKIGLASQFSQGVGSSAAQAYCYRRSTGENIELVANSTSATLWAVDAFCRDMLHVTWPVADGQMALVGPVQSTLSVNPPTVVSAPDFTRRGWILGENINAQGYSYVIGQWMSQSQQNVNFCLPANLSISAMDLKAAEGIDTDTSDSDFSWLIPSSTYGTTHPEYFPLINGVRTIPNPTSNPDSISIQLDLANPNVQSITAGLAQQTFGSYPQLTVFGASQNDGSGGWSTDAASVAWEGSQAGTGQMSNEVVNFVNSIAGKVSISNPGKLVGTLAYSDSNAPPTIPVAPNVAITFTTGGRNYMKALTDPTDSTNVSVMSKLSGWLAKASHVRLWEYYYYSGIQYCPCPWSRTLCNEFHNLHTLGLEGMSGETLPSQWSGMSLFSYTFSRLSWNTSLTYQQILTDFCNERYGPAAAPMQAYHQLYEDTIYANVPLFTGQGAGEQLLPNAFTTAQMTTLGNDLASATAIAQQSGSPYNQMEVSEEATVFKAFQQLRVDPATLTGIGPNLVVNPGAESRSSGWGTDIESGAYTLTTPTGGAHSGSRSFLVHCTGTAGWSRWYATVSGLTPGLNYTARFWVKATTGAYGYIDIYQSGVDNLIDIQGSGSKWVMVVCPQFTATSTSCNLYLTSLGTGDIYFDDVFVAKTPNGGASVLASTTIATTITSPNHATFGVGQLGNFTVTATGSPTIYYTATAASGTWPSWASFNTLTGVLSGTPPDASGSPYNFTIVASNGLASAASQSFTLNVVPLAVPKLLSAASSQLNGGTSYSIALPLTGNIGVENRVTGGTLQLVFTFDQSIISGSATTSVGKISNSPACSGNTMTVYVNNVDDQQNVKVTVSVVSSLNGTTGTGAVTLGALMGDVNGDGVVNSQDLVGVRNAVGTEAGDPSFDPADDINGDGVVNSQDLVQVRNHTGDELF